MEDFDQNERKMSLIPRAMQFFPTNIGGTADFSPTTAKGLSSFIGGRGLYGSKILRPLALAAFLTAPALDAFIKGYRWRKKALNPEGKQLSIHQSVYEAEPQEPASKPDQSNPKTVSGTSTTVNPTSQQSPGKLRPGGAGVNKPKTPKGPKTPKAAKVPESEKRKLDQRQKELSNPPQPSPEELQQQRISANAQQIYNRLSSKFGISGTGGQAKPPAATPGTPAKSPQAAKESFVEILRGKLMEAGRFPKKKKYRIADHYGSEHYPDLVKVTETAKRRKKSVGSALRSFLKSTADLSLHKGVTKHPFRSDDKKFFFTGRPLSMRNKLMAQHKRGQLQLPKGFGSFSPAQVGAHFDEMTDQGMLEPGRASLDPSNFNYFKRKAKRITKRTVGKVRGFLGGIVDRFRKKESDDSEKSSKLSESEVNDSCAFMEGDVDYPDQCSCVVCKETVEELIRESEQLSETSFTSMSQLGRSEPAAALRSVENVSSEKRDVIVRLLNNIAKKTRRRRKNAPSVKTDASAVVGSL